MKNKTYTIIKVERKGDGKHFKVSTGKGDYNFFVNGNPARRKEVTSLGVGSVIEAKVVERDGKPPFIDEFEVVKLRNLDSDESPSESVPKEQRIDSSTINTKLMCRKDIIVACVMKEGFDGTDMDIEEIDKLLKLL